MPEDIFISMIIGVIFAIVIYRGYICPPIIRGPNSKDIVNKIYFHNGKYYELEPQIIK